MDPIRFEKDLKVTIQALGWRSETRFLPLQDDIAIRLMDFLGVSLRLDQQRADAVRHRPDQY